MRMSVPFRLLAALFAMVSFAQLARADGFIVIHQPPPDAVRPGHFAFAPLEVSYHRVSVEIKDQVAVTSVDQEFYNPNGARMEGTYLFPLPEGAHIDKFSMDVNGRMTDAELLDAAKAKSIYEEIVRKYRDPALLEYVGKGAFKARVFPIEPHSKKQIKITYTQLLKSDTGLVEYTYPLNTEKFSARPLKDVSVRVTLACAEPIKSVYSPSHTVEVKRDGDRKAITAFEEKNVRPDTDFKLLFSTAKAPIGVDLLTYRNSPDDGYFLLLASPGFGASAATAVQKRDVCFVIDTSGSMAEAGGKKMEQAKKALSFCLANLNEGDRFEVVRFSTEAEALFGGNLVPADASNVGKANTFVAGLKPIGGTAIEDALKKAASLPRPDAAGRPYVIIFLTDGQPTVGETNEDKLVESVAKANVGNTRIFSFGIGTDVNTHLLDRVAAETKAFSQYVLPQEDLEVKLSTFYTKIKEPVLANVQVAFEGNVKASQVYPSAMPDLYKGEMLLAFGRYSGHGPAAVKVRGTLNGEPREFVTDVRFVERDLSNGYIPRLWATRRVGWLLDEIRLRGESAELKDEVTRLSREHGIVTPYTAYLIIEDERRRGVPIAMQNFRELDADGVTRLEVERQYTRAAGEARDRSLRAGTEAVATAQDIGGLKSSSNVDEVARGGAQLARRPHPAAQPSTGGFGGAAATGPVAAAPANEARDGYKVAQNYAQQARVVNGRAFYRNGDVWTDSTAQARKELKRKEVAFNSDEYFKIVAADRNAAQWLALGEQVDVVLGDTLYVVR